MSIYVFNNQQKIIKVLPYNRLIEATQEVELNGIDELTIEVPNKDWNKLEEEPLYLAVRDTVQRFSFHMYKILQEEVSDDTVTVKGIQIGYDEMKAYGYIKDRRFTQASIQSVANVIVEGTDWQTGFVDSDLPAITTNFYYISRLEAIRKVIEANGCEIRFRVEITGNKIVAKRIDFLKRMSSDKGKRFSYGSKLLSVVKETDSAELYTALVGRGKGEEVGDGYGRRIGFEDIEWSIYSGDPVDKPLGQEFVELPDMTALYGFPDGEPRTSVVVFEDTEDEALLLEQTYEKAVEMSRPQVQFKASVQGIGDVELGETVSIVRHDLNFKYKTRIFKIKRDILDNNRTEVELGDRITESLGRTIRRIDTTNQRREERIVEYVQNTADGKNKIFRQAATPDTGMIVNDLWYKPVGEGETELYRWNGNIWELEKVSAGLLGGTLDAENGDVNLINVNVANIVGETSEFVRSAWNSIAGQSVNVTGSGLLSTNATGDYSHITSGEVRSYDVGAAASAILGKGRAQFYNAGTSLFTVGKDILSSRTGGLIGATFMQRFAIGRYDRFVASGDGTPQFNPYIELGYSGTDSHRDANGVIRLLRSAFMGGTLHMEGNPIRNPSEITLANGGIINTISSTSQMRIRSSGQLQIGTNASWGLLMDNSYMYSYRNLSMEGNSITNQSDERLKNILGESDYDALSFFHDIIPKEWTWKDTERFGNQTEIGFVAQDVERLDPTLVTQTPDDSTDDGCAWAINETDMNRRAWVALHQLSRKVAEIDERTGVN